MVALSQERFLPHVANLCLSFSSKQVLELVLTLMAWALEVFQGSPPRSAPHPQVWLLLPGLRVAVGGVASKVLVRRKLWAGGVSSASLSWLHAAASSNSCHLSGGYKAVETQHLNTKCIFTHA